MLRSRGSSFKFRSLKFQVFKGVWEVGFLFFIEWFALKAIVFASFVIMRLNNCNRTNWIILVSLNCLVISRSLSSKQVVPRNLTRRRAIFRRFQEVDVWHYLIFFCILCLLVPFPVYNRAPFYFTGRENNTQLQANQNSRSAWRKARTVEGSPLERVWKPSGGCSD